MENTKYLKVAEIVTRLYSASTSERAHWMWRYHVPVVAKFAEGLVNKYGGNPDLAVSGAWLHDLADISMERTDQNHEKISLQKAKDVLHEAGFSTGEKNTIINDVLIPHSCYPGKLPQILEGKILSTADALGHITTDFYAQLCWQHRPYGKNYQEYRVWVKEKIERDFSSKIFFEEEKIKVLEKYRAIKLILAD